MTVSLAAERHGSPEATFELGQHRIVRKFLVLASSVLDGPIAVANAPGIPRMFQPYYYGVEFHPYCLVREIDPKRMGTSLSWEVTVTYSTPESKSPSYGGGSGSHPSKGDTGVDHPLDYKNPTLEIPDVETHFLTEKQPVYACQGWGQQASVSAGSSVVSIKNTTFMAVGDNVTVTFRGATNIGGTGGQLQIGAWPLQTLTTTTLQTTIQSVQTGVSVTLNKAWPGPTTTKAFLTDMNVKPPQSSAGEPFVPGLTMDSSSLILTISRNELLSAPHPALSMIYQDAVNSDSFWGALPGTCKVQSITCRRMTRQIDGGTTFAYLRVTYVFHFKPTWDLQPLDKGTYYWEAKSQLDQTLVKKTFRTEDGQQIEGLLDGNGGKLPDNGLPVFLSVRPYNWLPFSQLNLPQSFNQVQ